MDKGCDAQDKRRRIRQEKKMSVAIGNGIVWLREQ